MAFVRDWKKIDDLLMAGCLGTEIAGYLGIHPETLYRWVEEEKKMGFADYLLEKRSKGDSIIRAQQYAKALGLSDKGDNTLLIWLGKNRLKQRDNHDDLLTPANQSQIEKDHEMLSLRAEIASMKKKYENQ